MFVSDNHRVSTPKVHQNSRSFPGFLKVDLKFSRCKNYSYIEHCRSNIIQIRVLFVLTLFPALTSFDDMLFSAMTSFDDMPDSAMTRYDDLKTILGI